MPDTSPAPAADKRILAIQEVCARFCHAHMDAHHSVCATVHAELARSRASIGPDSERIRELEAENARLRKAYDQRIGELTELGLENARLRAAGLLPGPDDIVVSREALEAITTASSRERLEWAFDVIDAALSQPHAKETP